MIRAMRQAMRGATGTIGVRGATAERWTAAATLGAALLSGLVGLTGCGGKGADSPGNCPEGTVLKGSDCVPAESPSHASDDSAASGGGGGSSTSGTPSTGTSSSSSSTSSGSDSSGSTPESAPAGGKTPYDKDSVEIELKRAARQIKANCGSATDDSGASPGPWGKTSASLTLGRNGHVKDVSVPAPYDSAPDGVCAANAFKKIQFPPYSSSSDVVIEWDIELVKPKH
jgi:hypothetical protein